MQSFPPCIQVSQVNERNVQETLRIQGLIRQEIYELILKGNERDSFDLSKFSATHTKRDIKRTRQLLTDIVNELTALGWKTQFSYGDTALFIFADKKPDNCYDDGL